MREFPRFSTFTTANVVERAAGWRSATAFVVLIGAFAWPALLGYVG